MMSTVLQDGRKAIILIIPLYIITARLEAKQYECQGPGVGVVQYMNFVDHHWKIDQFRGETRL